MDYVLYSSSAVTPFDDIVLHDILETSRDANLSHDVTGTLLYHDGSIIQYFEGDPSAVEQLYANIRADHRHTGIFTLLKGHIQERAFPDWSMGYQPQNPENHEIVAAFFDLNRDALEQRLTDGLPDAALTLMRTFYRMTDRHTA